MTLDIIALAVLLLFSGFFSSAETALFSISMTQARHLAKTPLRSFQLIHRLKEDPHRLLTTILIGNNVVNVGASALATALALRLVPNHAVGYAVFVMTFLILVFGEVFPKSIATRNNVLIARLTIYPIYWLSLALSPIIWFLNFIPRITGRFERKRTVTEEELMTIVEVGEEQGEIREEEKELISNIFEFDDTNAYEIMTPRADMFVIDTQDPLSLAQISKSGFTRVPVIEDSIDNVVGIINIKDLFNQMAKSQEKIDIQKLMRPPYFVPENKKLNSLLAQFKKKKNHLAIVVDEHGGVSGLISLEDVLEEIVGEISDETDKEEQLIVKTNPQEWMVLGKTDIEDVNLTLGMEIPDISEYDTFSGYILDLIGRIPREKEEIAIEGY
ncbi:MAG: hemolysin family protein, partial [Desulfobacterales bacterium]